MGLCMVALVWPPAAPAQAQRPTALLERVAAYVQGFVDDLTNVVAEEQYLQQFRMAVERRRLKSDFLLVKYPGEKQTYLTFRDVMEVNGRPVGDQQQRVTRLFLEPFDSAIRRAGEIQAASFLHSVPRGRLVDPLEAMSYLQVFYQRDFDFTIGGDARGRGNAVEINFSQRLPPGSNLIPLRGKVWVEERSGRVLKTELLSGARLNVRYTTTEFGMNPTLGIDVPIRLRDEVPVGAGDEFIGVAEYSNFRRFRVHAEQQVDVPAPK